MPITITLAAVVVGCSLPLMWWSLAAGRTPVRSARDNLGGSDLRQAVLSRSATDRALRPLGHFLAERGRRLTPAGWIAALDRRRILAGQPPAWPMERLLAAKVVLAIGGLLVGYMLFSSNRTVMWFLLWMAITALAYFTPDLLLISRGQERQAEIQRELPDTLDQMTIAVEAGLAFDSAMARSARTGTGPLAQEFTRTLQEAQLGVSRSAALRHLMERTNVPDLRHFVLALIQAEIYGIPVADVLRTQAAELRVKRRQRAEEHAMKIPVKIIFPVVLCILPALFIVILGPAAIRIAKAFSGAG